MPRVPKRIAGRRSEKHRYATRSKYFEFSEVGRAANTHSAHHNVNESEEEENEGARGGGGTDQGDGVGMGTRDEENDENHENGENNEDNGGGEDDEGGEDYEGEDDDEDEEDNRGDEDNEDDDDDDSGDDDDFHAKGIKRNSATILQRLNAVGRMNKKFKLRHDGYDAANGGTNDRCQGRAINPSTMLFLDILAKNNNRPWFAENETYYRTAKQNFDSFVEKLSQRIVEEIDTTVPELPLKDLVFRIYRDIRFSNDQTPYKIYLSAAWSRTGRKGPYAHYYMQVQPHGKSIIAGGIWHANAQALELLRRAVSRRPEQLKGILVQDGIARDFLGIKGKINENAVVNAFVVKNSEDALKTAPKGYPKDHPEIMLLRLRSFTIARSLTDDEVTDHGFLDQAANLLSKIEPLITYLNSVVMPDLNIDT